MLILSRRVGESLLLGEDIRITVLGVRGQQVRLGLEVPAQTPVYREEVYVKVRAVNQLAVETDGDDVWAAAELWNENESKSSIPG
jgi:carbon storage regulator